MISGLLKDMFFSVILEILHGLVPLFVVLASSLLALGVIFVLYRDVVRFVAGEMWSNYKAEQAERFANSPVGRAVNAYKECASVHDGAEVYVESYSLGPKEHSENVGDFSGYDYSGYGNVEFHEED